MSRFPAEANPQFTLVTHPVRWTIRVFGRYILLALGFSVLWGWVLVSQHFASVHGPSYRLGELILSRGDQEPAEATYFTLGRELLMQNEVRGAAAQHHIRFIAHADGRWQVGNASASRQLVMEFADGLEMRTTRQMAAGASAILLSSRDEVTEIVIREVSLNAIRLDLVRGPQNRASAIFARYSIRMEGAQARICLLLAKGEDCTSLATGFVDSMRHVMRSYAALRKPQERLIARFGGEPLGLSGKAGVVPVPGYGFDGIRLVWLPGRGFAFAPGWDAHAEFVAMRGGTAVSRWRFGDIHHDISGKTASQTLKRLIAGRTVYAVDLSLEQTLRLRPERNHHRHHLPEDSSALRADQAPFEGRGQIRVERQVKAIKPLTQIWRESWPGMKGWLLLVPFLVVLVFLLVVRGVYVQVQGHFGLSDPFAVLSDVLGCILVALAVTCVFAMMGPWAVVSGDDGQPPAPYPAIAAWGIAMLAVFRSPRSGLHMLALFNLFTGLIATGTVVLLAMAVSVDDLRWSRFYTETLGAITLGSVLVALTMLVPVQILSRGALVLSRKGTLADLTGFLGLSWGLLLLMIFCLGNWAVWFLFGTEAGIAGLFQPSEVIKTLYAILFAALMTLILLRKFGGRAAGSSLAIVMSFTGVLTILLLMMSQPITANDFSPFLILSLSSALAMGLVVLLNIAARLSERFSPRVRAGQAPPDPDDPPLTVWRRLRQDPQIAFYRCLKAIVSGAKKRLVDIGVLGALLVLVLGLLTVRNHALEQPEQVRIWLEEEAPSFIRKPARRVVSWLELSLYRKPPATQGAMIIDYPDTGRQVLMSRQAIDQAPCRVLPLQLETGSWQEFNRVVRWMKSLLAEVCPNGSKSQPMPAVTDLGLPEIQNDFIVAWVFTALGRDGALLLCLLEMATIILMLVAAFRIMNWETVDDDRRIATTFFANLIIIFSIMLFLQFAISWMNAFGELPVMGQPMTFISQGRSHFLAFGIPVILSILTGLQLMHDEPVRRFSPLPAHGPRRYRSIVSGTFMPGPPQDIRVPQHS